MKLSRVELLTHVADPKSVNTPKVSNFRTHRGEEATGYELEWDEGLVTIRHAGNTVIVPVGNVAFMVPAFVPALGDAALDALIARGTAEYEARPKGPTEAPMPGEWVTPPDAPKRGGWPKGKPRKAMAEP